MNFYIDRNQAFILDDHVLFGDSIARVLEEYKLFDKVFSFNTDKSLLSTLVGLRPEIQPTLFLDYHIGEKILPPILSEIRRLVKKAKVVILSGVENPKLVHDLDKLDPDGFIHKTDNIQIIIECVNEINRGRKYRSPYVKTLLEKGQLQENTNSFSSREIELITCFAKGLSVQETADVLNISPHTVSTHRKKMFRKVNCNNLTELLTYAREIGVLQSI